MGIKRQIDIEVRKRVVRWIKYLMEKYAHQYPTAQSFARAIGVSPPALNMVLNGSRFPGMDLVLGIHTRLHISCDVLVDTDPPVSDAKKEQSA